MILWSHKYETSPTVTFVLASALLFRLLGLWGTPLFEDDYFRYLWDGYRFVATGTPYGWIPAEFFADPTLPVAAQRLLDQINYPELPTIYGPVIQLVFALAHLIAPFELWSIQALLVAFDLGLIFLVRNKVPTKWLLMYAWCPLLIKEVAFAAHPDIIAIYLSFLALVMRFADRHLWAAVALALAVAAKVFAVLLIPFVLWRSPLRAPILFALTLGVCYLPFLYFGDTDLQALLVFAESWEFNAALYALLSNAMDPMLAKFMLAIGCSLLIAYYWVKWRGEPQWSIPRGDWIFGLFLLCAPVINAWYVLWILPFAMLYPSRWAWMASVVVVLAYITSWTLGDFSQEPFAQPWWTRALQFGAVGAMLIWDFQRPIQSGRNQANTTWQTV